MSPSSSSKTLSPEGSSPFKAMPSGDTSAQTHGLQETFHIQTTAVRNGKYLENKMIPGNQRPQKGKAAVVNILEIDSLKKMEIGLMVVAHTLNSRTQEAEAGGSQ